MVPTTVIEIFCADIEVVDNIRQARDVEKVQAIALSAREQGFKAPITVERGETKPYRLIDGWHRLGACDLLGLTTIQALVVEEPLTDAARVESQLVLNALRSDLTPIEKAQAFQRLLDISGEPKGKIAQRIGMSPSAATRLLALLTLSTELQTAIQTGLVAADTGYKLSGIKDAVRRQALEQAALAGALTRDAVAPPNKRRPAMSSQGADDSRKQTITLLTAAERTLAFTGPAVTLEQFVADLELALRKARAALKRNLSLPQFAELMNAQASAGGAL